MIGLWYAKMVGNSTYFPNQLRELFDPVIAEELKKMINKFESDRQEHARQEAEKERKKQGDQLYLIDLNDQKLFPQRDLYP